MLYCPKCNDTYEEGVQRFCSNDGSRLIPSASGGQPKGIFSSALKRASASKERSNTFTELPNLTNPEQNLPKKETHSSAPENYPKPEQSREPEKKLQIPKPEEQILSSKPARLIKPNEVPASQASLGDRAVNPTGRQPLTWDNPQVLTGQTIKGRYSITGELGKDETGLAYLADDRIGDRKKVVVRILMNEDADNESSKILAEERVSLSHVNHPNVAHLFDSGELSEGYPFIITEYVEGTSVKEKIKGKEKFDARRVARIIRQAANALSEAHQNGVLHRNLKPKNIILGISESGIELIKVTDFGVFDGFEEQSIENIAYLAPEQLEGKTASFASDIYSLAVIAFQMLTGRLPFDFSSGKSLLKAQREGLKLLPTDIQNDIPPLVDGIIVKALSSNAEQRYPKARDFGDAFYNSLTTILPIKEQPQKQEKILFVPKAISIPKPSEVEGEIEAKNKPLVAETIKVPETIKEAEAIKAPSVSKPISFQAQASSEIKKVKSGDAAWEKRSPEPPKTINAWRIGTMVLLIMLMFAGLWGIWHYFLNRPEAPAFVPSKADIANQNAVENNNANSPENADTQNTKPVAEVDSPPLPRNIQPPPDTTFFQNSKENLNADLAKNFRGFSFYYPKDWVKNPSPKSFVDVSRVGATGTPIEQITVTYYDSKGTMMGDMDRFPRLVQEANKKLGGLISDYRPMTQGVTTINDGWKAYELKFQGSGKTTNGDTITLWGRCLWIPAARLGVKTGFVVTMLATSNSPEVKSVGDVGVKGELAGVLETFEPAPLDTGYQQ